MLNWNQETADAVGQIVIQFVSTQIDGLLQILRMFVPYNDETDMNVASLYNNI